MSEQVIRHRGGGRDENGQLLPVTDQPLRAIEVAPGGGAEYGDQSRAGETVSCTAYFQPGTDLVNSDELTVRGDRYSIVVNDWRSGGRGGLEVLCTRGQG